MQTNLGVGSWQLAVGSLERQVQSCLAFVTRPVGFPQDCTYSRQRKVPDLLSPSRWRSLP